MTVPLLLASASPRRRALLETVGLAAEVLPVAIDETPRAGEAAEALARRLAREKALAAASAHPGRTVLAADTVVALGDETLGKPEDAPAARAMLERLSGRWHRVVTAIALVTEDGRVLIDHAVTEVRFAALAPAEIERYAAGTEPYDKAGGYALQGAAGWFVEELRGSPSNVVGLPLERLRRLLAEAGHPPPRLG